MQPTFTRDRLTWVSYWMLGYFSFFQTILGPLMPFLRRDLHLSYTVASLHFSAFAFGATLMGGLGERIAQRWGRRAAFWGGSSGMAAGALLLALAPYPIATILAAFLMGLLGALLLVTIQATLADHHSAWRSVALTEANIFASIFAILSALTVGFITGISLSWRLALIPPMLLLALLAVRYRAVPFKRAQYNIKLKHHTSSYGRLPLRFWEFSCLVVLETGVEWCIAYWGAEFLAVRGGLSAADAATATSIFFVAMVIGRYTSSRLTRRLPGLVVLFAALCIALAGFPLFWLAPTSALHLVGLFVVGLGLASVYPLALALATEAVPEQADRASARMTLSSSAAILIAPFILGALADHIGIGNAFGIAIPLLLAAIASVLLASHTKPALSK